MSAAKKSVSAAVARLAPSATAKKLMGALVDSLADGASFVLHDRSTIFSEPVRTMEKGAVVATFCVLKRSHAAIDRRLKIVRERLEDLFDELPAIAAGDPGRELVAGAFKVTQDNTNAKKTTLDVAFLKKLCADRAIPWSDVTDQAPTVPAFTPPPSVNATKVRALLADKRITEKQLAKCFVAMEPKLELNVHVPDVVETVIEKQLLGDINTEKLPKKEK